ncbi:MAG: C25 family cysteine peptidase [Chloroflexota bacterium]|nr:C25 family cysteine peptidase [Chloroflexota bacterium]
MSKVFSRFCLIAVLLVTFAGGFNRYSLPLALAESDGPQLLRTESSGLVFDLSVPLPVVEEVSIEGNQFHRLELPEYGAYGEIGQAELLQRGLLVGIPVGAEVTVRILETEVEEFPEPLHIAPVLKREINYDPETGKPDLVPGVLERYSLDEGFYTTDEFAPADIVVVDEIGFIRQQRFVRIVLRPLQYNPATGQLRVHRYLRVEVTFSGQEAGWLAGGEIQGNDPFDPILRSQLLNFEQARQWRAPHRPDLREVARSNIGYPGDMAGPWFKTSLRHTGLYKVTLQELQDASLAPLATADPALLQVWHNGEELAATFHGDADASFDEGEALIFYTDVPRSLYSETDVFWLTVGNQARRMSSIDATPSGLPPESSVPERIQLEEDFIFRHDLPDYSAPEPDYPRWYWAEIHNLFNPNLEISAVLNDAVTNGYNATLRVRLMGWTKIPDVNPDHHVTVSVNGHQVGDLLWDGQKEIIEQVQFPASHLIAGLNTIQFNAPGDLPGVFLDHSYLDRVELGYRQYTRARNDRLLFGSESYGALEFEIQGFTQPGAFVFDVTDSLSPLRLTGVQTGGTHSATEAGPTIEGQTDLSEKLFLPAFGAGGEATSGNISVRFQRSLSGEHRFAVASLDGINRVPAIVRDRGSDLRNVANQADYLLITHDDFAGAAGLLRDHRAGQGLTTLLIDVQDIYDEYSGGRLDPGAIRDFVDYAYHNWQMPQPTYILLLGGGHFDYRMTTGSAGYPNFIPPYFACVDPWVCEVAVDNEFAAVNGADRMPDMAIGRLPAHDLTEAMVMVNKIISYETAPPPGAWQQTITFVADDKDNAGDFEAMSEAVIAQVPQSYAIDRIYFDPIPDDDDGEPFRYRTQPEATQAILDAINEGRMMVNWAGHSGTTGWAHERLLRANPATRNDILEMHNGARLPVFLDMACLSGNFADIYYPSVEASLLGWDQGGSVGGWAATGFGVATGHDLLHHGFFDALFQQDVSQFGLAAIAGKVHLQAQGRSLDLLDTFGLLGDPALQIITNH